ncbi:hypothetical protein ACFV6F_35155 [Kitasatospora phosalacinea]|uniref:hypothetical protein n=1 Tax=Kitasatospora phosalacinea TaxID=2065 RepID=UPI003647B009
MRWECVEHVPQERYDVLEVHFAKALDPYREGGRSSPGAAASELSDSLASVLLVAASLAGKEQLTLRFALHPLEEDHARHVAEAVLHSAGFLDATADPWGGEPENRPRGSGPHSTARQRRWWEDMMQPDEPR